jgi:hypothetical protein
MVGYARLVWPEDDSRNRLCWCEKALGDEEET